MICLMKIRLRIYAVRTRGIALKILFFFIMSEFKNHNCYKSEHSGKS